MSRERSYDQYCGLARTLDLVGDRWNLLLVRELLAGPRRFRDLSASLPGIATNLLTDRLRRLEAGGVVERMLLGGASAYGLTPWGLGLREPIEGLVRWSTPLMATGPRPTDTFEPRWLTVALPALIPPRRSGSTVEIGVEVAGTLLAVRVGRDGSTVAVDPEERPVAVVVGDAHLVLGLAAGMLDVDHPGLTIEGDRRVVGDVFSSESP